MKGRLSDWLQKLVTVHENWPRCASVFHGTPRSVSALLGSYGALSHPPSQEIYAEEQPRWPRWTVCHFSTLIKSQGLLLLLPPLDRRGHRVL